MRKTRSPNVASSSGSGYSRRSDAAAASADDAQKKFGGAKGISSDMYFGLVLLSHIAVL